MLQDFLADAARSEHVWSQSDCAMTIANWWRWKHGVDPAADLRGSYSTEQECLAVLSDHGGMRAVVAECAGRVSAKPTSSPVAGDFGVIDVHGTEYAAILGPSGRWIVKSQHGIAGYRCPPLCAWSA